MIKHVFVIDITKESGGCNKFQPISLGISLNENVTYIQMLFSSLAKINCTSNFAIMKSYSDKAIVRNILNRPTRTLESFGP